MSTQVLEMQPFTESNDILDDPAAIGRRMRADGYLFFRELLPREEVLELRRRILGFCAEAGWLQDGADLTEGLTDHEPVMEGDPEHIPVYEKIQAMESFHQLAHHPGVQQVMEAIFEEPVFCHPNKIARVAFPRDNERATPPHQDFLYIQGSTETISCWAPLGDLPDSHGGLMVQPGTHKSGFQIPRKHPGVGGHTIEADPDKPWLTSEFKAGDVLMFQALTIHSAKPNTTKDRLRLSMDFRYTGVSHTVCESNRPPHFHWSSERLSWDELDKNWDPAFRRYWESMPQIRWAPYEGKLLQVADI